MLELDDFDSRCPEGYWWNFVQSKCQKILPAIFDEVPINELPVAPENQGSGGFSLVTQLVIFLSVVAAILWVLRWRKLRK